MPLLPVIHGPANSKKKDGGSHSANSSPRLSPSIGPSNNNNNNNNSDGTGETSSKRNPNGTHHHGGSSTHLHAPGIARPLLKKYHSSPIAPTLKSFGGGNQNNHSTSNSGTVTPKHGSSHLRYGSGSNLAVYPPSSPNGSSSPGTPGSLTPHSPKPRHAPPPPPQIQISFNIESPPLVLYGSPRESTGALLSGFFQLHVLNNPVDMKRVRLSVVQKVHSKKQSNTNPHATNAHHILPHKCKDCATNTTELAVWDVLPAATTLPKQAHGYPFSHLLPGSLPASANNSLFSVEYYLTVEAVFQDENIQPYILTKPLKISRAIVRSSDRNSVRVFPPTTLTSSVTIPSVIFPNSQFSFEMSLEGISMPPKNDDENDENTTSSSNTRWRMRKMNWRVDEVMKMNPNKCPTHNPEADKPEVQETRTIGSGEFKSGWKTDFSGNGKIELSGFDISTHAANVCCNIDDPTLGLSVTHVLVVELVVAEETVTQKSNSRQAVPTGAARVLRMQFNLTITERSGLGIAWDDEVPPTYGDVPLSPPTYDTTLSLPTVEDVSPGTYANGYVEGINERLALSQL